jgi:hypothetical protein
MGYIPRDPEQPRWALMVSPNTPASIVCVREEHADSKVSMGWILVARESELLPFNPPRLIPDSEPLPSFRSIVKKKEKDEADGA